MDINTKPIIVSCFQDSTGNKHLTKAVFLAAEKIICFRGVVQSDPMSGKNASFTATQVAEIISRNAALINKVNKKFTIAINRANGKKKSNFNSEVYESHKQ